jgi:hypothetical protein
LDHRARCAPAAFRASTDACTRRGTDGRQRSAADTESRRAPVGAINGPVTSPGRLHASRVSSPAAPAHSLEWRDSPQCALRQIRRPAYRLASCRRKDELPLALVRGQRPRTNSFGAAMRDSDMRGSPHSVQCAEACIPDSVLDTHTARVPTGRLSLSIMNDSVHMYRNAWKR